MNRGVVLAALLMMSIFAMPAQAQEPAVVLAQEDAGDVMLRSADGSIDQADTTGVHENVDLREIGIFAEDDLSVTFYIKLDSLTESSQNPLPFSDPDYRIHFQFGETQYRVRVDTSLENPANSAFGRDGGVFSRLEIQVSEGQWRPVVDVESELHFAENMVTSIVPREAVFDHNQAPLSINRTLTHIWAQAQAMGWFSFPVGSFQQGGDGLIRVGAPMVYDQIPNDPMDAQLPVYQMTAGPMKQKGGLVAASADPVRWTNGEASTLTFQARVTNTDSKDIPVTVEVRGADPAWTVAYSDRLTIPAADAINVTFLVTIPFGHAHGKLHMFEAVFSSEDKKHFAAADLGVYWPEVPQPAGHHNQIWFHSAPAEQSGFALFDQFQSTSAWMSAKEDEDHDASLPVPSRFTIPPLPMTGNQGIAYWSIPLEPSLRMGLDFRPEEDGSIELHLNFPTPVVDPTVTFYLNHVQGSGQRGGIGGDSILLASGKSETLSGAISGDQSFEIPLEISDDADLIQYEPETNIVATILVTATYMTGGGFLNPEGVVPEFLPADSVMTLPLNEYEDPLDLSFRTDGSLEILAGPEGQQRLVNAGRTVVYTFDITYTGADPAGFHTMLTGLNAEWGQVIGDTSFDLSPGETRRLGLAVKAPIGASDGERADLTLTVMNHKNAAIQAGINTVTIVDSKEDIPDEAARKENLDSELTSKKESPGIAIAVLLGALVVLARRRQ